MADIISVTPEKLKSTASLFQQTGSEIRKTGADMLQLVSSISSSIWSGDACAAYIGKFKGLDTDINKMYKMIEDEVQHLMTIAQEYQTAEQENKVAAASLKNNVIV